MPPCLSWTGFFTEHLCVCECTVRHVQFSATPWTAAHQVPWSMGFPRQVCCYFLFEAVFAAQGSNPRLQHWQADSLPLSRLGGISLILLTAPPPSTRVLTMDSPHSLENILKMDLGFRGGPVVKTSHCHFRERGFSL